MDLEARYVWVGSVVVLLLGIAITTGLWLVYGDNEQDRRLYRILFEEQSLAGLDVNSTVTMRGIRVGQVLRLRILPSHKEGIEVVIAVAPDVPVRNSMHAVIDRNLLTGLSSIDLRKESQEEGELIAGAEFNLDGSIPQYLPRIDEGKVALTQITESATGIMQKLSATLEKMNSVMNEENQAAITRIIANVEEVTSELAKNKDGVAGLVGNADRAAIEFAKLAADARGVLVNVSEEFASISMALKRQINLFAQLSSSINERVTAASEPFERPREILLGPNSKNLGPGERNFR